MRHRRGARLVGSWGVAAALFGMLAASSGSAVAAPPIVPLHLTINGSGTLRVSGNPAFTCHAHFPTSSHCRHTFYIRKGRRIVIKESPASGWRLWSWTGACHGSAASCSLRVKARRFGSVTASFVPPGNRFNPYPLGTAVTLAWGWRLTVDAANLNDPAAIDPVNCGPLKPGYQAALITVSVTNEGVYANDPSDYLSTFLVFRSQKFGDDSCGTLGENFSGTLDPGHTRTGDMNVVIPSKYAAITVLGGYSTLPTTGEPGPPDVWFALH